MAADQRGVLYIVWGTYDQAILDRAQQSLALHHPELPVHVEILPDNSTLLDKARMLEYTPFKETLFLDMDTIVLGNLDFGFEKARAFNVAMSICECPWARRYGSIEGDIVEYNTGVIFFTEKAKPLFDAWTDCTATVDSSMEFMIDGQVGCMPLNDQGGFAQAVEDTSLVPFVLPQNWNFRPRWQKSWYGPLKVWHDYDPVPEALIEHNNRQAQDDIVLLSSSLGR